MTETTESPEWSDNISLLHNTTLNLPPSCLEFIPKPSSDLDVSPHLRDHHHEYFVVGTYCLEKDESSEAFETQNDEESEEQASVVAKPQSKNGSLILFRYHNESLEIVQTLQYESAVFDLHFLPSSPIFAIVSSSGTVSIFTITTSPSPFLSTTTSPTISIQLIATHQVFTSDIAPTYFAWAPNSQHSMCITTSSGVYLVSFSSSYDSFKILNNGEPVIMHTEYAWCCAFSLNPSSNMLYSGGDDNKLRLENLGSILTNLDSEEEIEPSGLWTKGIGGHEAGVTFILPLPIPTSNGDGGGEGKGEEEVEFLLTGSYDDHIRILSIPSYPSRPKLLTSLPLGGGVWRLKFLDPPSTSPSSPNPTVDCTVLASCMHAGARIISVLGTFQEQAWKWEINVLAEMRLHKSMNYASDVQPLPSPSTETTEKEENTRVCISSSFYDRLLCVWRWDSKLSSTRREG